MTRRDRLTALDVRSASLLWIRAVNDAQRPPEAVSILLRSPPADGGGHHGLRQMGTGGGNTDSSGLWGFLSPLDRWSRHTIELGHYPSRCTKRHISKENAARQALFPLAKMK